MFARRRYASRVAQLFLVILYRMRVASDLMSQYLRLIVGLAEALDAVTAVPLPHFAERGTWPWEPFKVMLRTTKTKLDLRCSSLKSALPPK